MIHKCFSSLALALTHTSSFFEDLRGSNKIRDISTLVLVFCKQVFLTFFEKMFHRGRNTMANKYIGSPPKFIFRPQQNTISSTTLAKVKRKKASLGHLGGTVG